MSLSIQGKTAIVTGAGRGIGLAIARHFREAGANVVYADCDESLLEVELGGQAQDSGRVRAFSGDLGERLTQSNLVSAAIDAFDRIDILVNAHRLMLQSDPEVTTEEQIARMLRQNMSAALRLSQLVARRMAEQSGNDLPPVQAGAIVNVVSLAAERPTEENLAYSIASAALVQATRTLAVTLAPKRIRVNGLGFASVMSNQLQMRLREEPALRDRLIAATPLARIAGAEELGPAAQFLASEAAGFITGQILRIDGGRSLADGMTPAVY